MSPPDGTKPAPALAGNGPRKIDQVGHQINLTRNSEADTAQPFQDRYGHPHTEAVLRHWSPAILKVLGIRRVEPEGGAV